MDIETRLVRLELANRRLRAVVVLLALVLAVPPLMSALQGSGQANGLPLQQEATDNVVLQGKNGWSLVLGTRAGKRGGFGLFLLDKKGQSRGRLAVDGKSPRVEVCSAKGEHGAALVAEDETSTALGIWQGEQWRLRSEIKHGRPNSFVYDDEGKTRLRYGMYKGDTYLTIVDEDGETDRAWLMLESTNRASIAVRGAKRAEASMSASPEAPVGVSVRDAKGRLRALMYTHEAAAQIVAYDEDETSRAALRATGKGLVDLQVVDKDDKARLEAGLNAAAAASLRLIDPQGKPVYEAPSK